MGFLGTRAGIYSDLTLIIAIAGFIILCLGVLYAKRGKLSDHFKMTRLAVLLLVMVFIWMGPRFIGSFHFIISHITGLQSLIMLFHVVIGASVLLSGIFLAFDRLINKTRSHMRIVFVLWILALFLGIYMYIIFYI